LIINNFSSKNITGQCPRGVSVFLNKQVKFVMEIPSQRVTLITLVTLISWAPKAESRNMSLSIAPVLRKDGIRKRKCSVSNSNEDEVDKQPDLKYYNLSIAQFWLETENDELTNHIT